MTSLRTSTATSTKINSVNSGPSSILQPWQIRLPSPTYPRPFSDPKSTTTREDLDQGATSNIKLSFFERHFTKPTNRETQCDRQFAFRSRGFIITAVVLVFVLLNAMAAVLTLSLTAHGPKTAGSEAQANNSSSSSPIHLAILENFPDPSLLRVNGTWYAYATNNAAGILHNAESVRPDAFNATYNVQLATSTDLAHWSLNDARGLLPDPGEWALPGYSNTTPSVPLARVWAPSIIQRPTDGLYILYYSGFPKVPEVTIVNKHRLYSHCIGAAISNGDLPTGPFSPMEDSLICAGAQGGAIDQYPFLDVDGSLYLTYKIDGNNLGHGGSCSNSAKPIQSTPIMLQKLKSDGVTLDGEPIQILDRIDSDGPLVEAPAIIRSKEGVYFLFFSSGCTADPSYDIKYATATNINGPYTRAPAALISTGDWDMHAPGSIGIAQDENGDLVMAFHARVWLSYGGVRAMFTTRLDLKGDIACIYGTNTTVGYCKV